MRTRRLGLILTVALVAPIAAVLADQPAPGPGKAKAVPACRADADCVLVAEDCCGCEAGGKQRAIPARTKEAYEAKRQARCKETMCTTMMSNDSSCTARGAACKEGKCVLAP